MKETRLGRKSARNLVRRGHYIRVKISIMGNFTLKEMSVSSRYNTIMKQSIEEIV